MHDCACRQWTTPRRGHAPAWETESRWQPTRMQIVRRLRWPRCRQTARLQSTGKPAILVQCLLVYEADSSC